MVHHSFGEVRQQYNAVTDAHDQHRAPIKAMLETAKAYGHTPPAVVFTDNPQQDKRELLSAIPALQERQVSFALHVPGRMGGGVVGSAATFDRCRQLYAHLLL